MKLVIYITGLGLFILLMSLGFLVRAGWTAPSAFSADTFARKLTDLIENEISATSVSTFSQTDENLKELLPVSALLPQTFSFSSGDLHALIEFAESCDPALKFNASDLRLKKAIQFTEIICGLALTPVGFFNQPPFIHPLGRSFVARAYTSGNPVFGDAWLFANKSFLHVLEFRQAYPNEKETLYGPATFLNKAANRAWVSSAPLVVVDQDIWVLKTFGEAHQSADASYSVYKLDSVNQKLEPKGIRIVENKPNLECLMTGESFCVQTDNFFARGRILALRILWISIFLISAGLSLYVVLWSQSRARMREERAMVIRTLAHELRTPATSIGISLEVLRNDFERLSEGGQSAYLRMADDIRRLKRLIDGSKSYLKANSDQRYAKERIDMSSFLEKLIEPFGPSVVLHAPNESLFAFSHPYWLGICLSNLIENSLKHGKPPCRIAITSDKTNCFLTIEDAGSFSTKEYLNLRKEFAKGATSSGMGLGLSIILSTLKKLGHNLEFFENPTRFKITIRNS